jgi:taspase (threonine aspartase 1)
MESFILEDFMDHPGVRCQSSPAAIGVMAVKQTRSACYLYFGHNTDSFALCSMSTKDKEPLLTMSRVGEVRRIARGARKIALD